MADYINKQAFLDYMKRTDRYFNVKFDIENFPNADVAPVRHGQWIPLTECANEGVYCSICKKKVWKSDYAQCSKKSRNKLESNYCPNCGAKMDEKENDNATY